ncbi:hypothetical protein G9A89_002858 [Geosiphon pyriformis]|nr:hypothetical protein G9A89_002858 [Geosiphon pyriformis]
MQPGETCYTVPLNTNTYNFDNLNSGAPESTHFMTDNSLRLGVGAGHHILDLDILNTSSLNFARPESARLSHTAATTAARRVLYDRELLRLRILTKVSSSNHQSRDENIINKPWPLNDDWSAPNNWWPVSSQPPTKALNDSGPTLYKKQKHQHQYSMERAEKTVTRENFDNQSEIKEFQIDHQGKNKQNQIVSLFEKEEIKGTNFRPSLNSVQFLNRRVSAPAYTYSYFSEPENSNHPINKPSSMNKLSNMKENGNFQDIRPSTQIPNPVINFPSEISSSPVEENNLAVQITSNFASALSLAFASSSSITQNQMSSFSSIIPTDEPSSFTLSSIVTSSTLPSPTNLSSPSQPPSLSPCSSKSSLSSSIDMLSPVTQMESKFLQGANDQQTNNNNNNNNNNHDINANTFNKNLCESTNVASPSRNKVQFNVLHPHSRESTYPPTKSNFNVSAQNSHFREQRDKYEPFTTNHSKNINGRPKSKSICTENPFSQRAFSAPTISSDAYSGIQSPAASWLGFLADATVSTRLPDEEGEQVGEYILGKVIGRGGFSCVREAYTMDSGVMEKVAVKIVKNDPDSKHNDRLQALLEKEIEIWRHLDNPNIVRMISFEETEYASFIFAELCPGGTLLEYIKKNGNVDERGLNEDQARIIFLQIAEAVRYLHNDMGLVHKDIKLDNILLDSEGNWKLGDFGLSEYQRAEYAHDSRCDGHAGGSLAYCPPEQLRSKTPIKDTSVDIWSLGVVLYAMVTGRLPFNDDFEPRLQYKILNGRFEEPPLENVNASNELRELLNGMFKTKPDQRLTINQILDSRWCRL